MEWIFLSEGLVYFKEVYGTVPGWVGKMYAYRSEALDHYTNLRSAIMQEGYLSTKEKDLLLVGINAARRYERSMVYHTKGAIDGEATLPELAEYLLVPYLYGGVEAVRTGMESVRYALSLKGLPDEQIPDNASMDELLRYLLSITEENDGDYLMELLNATEARRNQLLLDHGAVSAKMKAMLMVGVYSTELQGSEAGVWMELARENGASDEELAEVGLICLLTAGIPAWFEASDSLQDRGV